MGERDEFECIREIERRLAIATAGSGVEVGIGDDAAVLAPARGRQVLSVDAAVEGVHFRLDLMSPADAGFRSLVAALSDLAAMGARPRAALCAWIVPESLAQDDLFRIADGVAEASRLYRTPVVGGNLARGAELSLTTTVVGECELAPLTRAGGRAGEALFVTGTLGDAALGLRALLEGRGELAPAAVQRFRRPSARIEEGLRLVALASAAIDISDGLLQDLGHLCDASGVGAEIEVAQLPLAPELRRTAGALGLSDLELALGGGEDYELLFAAPVAEWPDATRIGHLRKGAGIRLLGADGRELSPPARPGFRHF